MSPRMPRTTSAGSLRNSTIVGLAAVIGLALGTGGVSLALWNDGALLQGQAHSGYETFAAGHAAGTMTAANDGSVRIAIGSDQAQILLEAGEIAIPLQTESLSQGNKGLRYTVSAPDWGEGVFGSSHPVVFAVDSAAACTVDRAPAAPDTLVSTPVSAAYSDTTTPVTEFWCVVAVLGDLPDEGAYENTATVTAKDETGIAVEEDDSWNAEVTTGLDPVDEADHILEFSYETFRP